MHVGVRAMARVWGSENNLFSPFTMWAPGIELRSAGLVENLYPLNHLTSLLFLLVFF